MKIPKIIEKLFTRARVTVQQGLGGLDYIIGGSTLKSGRAMGRDEALQVSAVFACVRFISGSISTLPAVLYKKLEDGGSERDKNNKLYRRLKYKPNRRQTAVQFWEQVMISLLMRGNAYIQVVQYPNGDIEMAALYPDYVKKAYNDEGYPIYEYTNHEKQEQRLFTDDDVIHIMAMAPDGSVGKSPLDYGMETVATAKAAEEHASVFFANGVNPSGVLIHQKNLSEPAAQRLKKKFDDNYANPNKSGGTMVLEEGMEWKPITMTSEQAQFLQTRQFQVREICRWFGLQPHKIGDLEDATFSNIEEENLNTIIDSLRPWMVRIEMSILTGLFAEDEWDNYSFEFMTDALLRGSIAARWETYVKAVNNSLMSPDEARAKENLNPIPNGEGKKFWRPLNMQVVGEEPKKLTAPPVATDPKADPTNPDAPNEPSDEPPADKTRQASVMILERAIEKVVRRAERRGNMDEKFKQQSELDLEPAFRAVLTLQGKDTDEAVRTLVESLYAELRSGLKKEQRWGVWAFEQVETV